MSPKLEFGTVSLFPLEKKMCLISRMLEGEEGLLDFEVRRVDLLWESGYLWHTRY